MKKIGTIILLSAIMIGLISFKASAAGQANDEKTMNNKPGEAVESESLPVESANIQDDSSHRLYSGLNRISILESLEVPGINFTDYSWRHNWDEDDNDHEGRRYRRRFHGHWTGVEFGFNNYVTSDNNTAMPAGIEYMTLNTGKSSNFNINFTQVSIGLSRHAGFVTGLGLNWNNYRFDGNNNIYTGADGIIQELDPGAELKKSKLATVYLTIPLLFEIQVPAEYNHLSISGGLIGAVKLGSHTKMVFDDGHTVKSYRDFNLNQLRYGYTARVGFGNFMIYGTYYATPLFQKGKGPGGVDLYPFEIGAALTFNN